MIVAAFSFSRTLLRILLISLVLWPGAALAQTSSDVQTEGEPLPLTEEQILDLYEEQPHPLTEEQALAQIRARLAQDRPEAALGLIERFLDQSDPPAFIDEFTFLQAVVLNTQGQPHQAVTTLEQFLEEYPGSPLVHEARLRLGALYTTLQQPDRAIPILSRILDLTPDPTLRAEAVHRLCLAYESNGEYLRAIQTAMTGAERLRENARRDLRDYVQRLILQKMDESSLDEVLESFSGTFPGDLALIRLIELRQARGDETLAERDIRAFLDRFPGHPYAQTATALLRTAVAGIKAHRHVIAVALPFSGTMKPFGIEALNGVRLALDEAEALLGAEAVGLVVKDSVIPPERIVRELSDLIHGFDPIALIGPLLAREVQLLADMPDLATVPFITPTATVPNVKRFGRYWFSTAMTPSLQIDRLVEYAMRRFGHTRFCLLTPRTALGRQWHHLFQRAVVHNGGELIAAEWYQPGTTDATAQITRIKKKDLSLYGEMLPLVPEEDSETTPVTDAGAPADEEEEPPMAYTPGFDALFLPGHPTDVAFLSAQLAFFDVNVSLLGTNTWNHPNLLKWGRSSIEGGMFGDALFLGSTDPETRRFITAYRERFQADPTIFALQAYDAMSVVLDAIRRGATTGPEVRWQLFVRHDIPTLGGMEKFDEGGILTRKVYMIQIQHGRFIQLN